jgi:hypothetical protein
MIMPIPVTFAIVWNSFQSGFFAITKTRLLEETKDLMLSTAFIKKIEKESIKKQDFCPVFSL